MDPAHGVVYLVGGGPGDPELITIKGSTLLHMAEVVIHDRLIAPALLSWAPPDAELIDVGKAPGGKGPSQDDINRLLVEQARAGRRVVRLKGGDPYIFGRGWEELQACRAAGVRCVVVPGVSSALAGPALADIPVTLRGVARGVVIATGHEGGESQEDTPDIQALSAIDTVVLLMGRARLADLTRRFIEHGRDPQTPAACIERATLPGERRVLATLATLAAEADRAALRAPVVVVIGAVAGCAAERPADTPLAGRRVLLTRARESVANLRLELHHRGAVVLEAPMIEIQFPQHTPELDPAIGDLTRFDWVIFTSVNSVRGFWKRLHLLKRDSRALGSCRVAAIGPATARAIAGHGISVDLMPDNYRATEMVKTLMRNTPRPASVLIPGSQIARPELADGLRRNGVTVTAAVAYHTVAGAPTAAELDDLRDGVDAILFNSPSAVRHFVDLHLPVGSAAIGCIGPTTAQAAREAGMTVAAVPLQHTDNGLVGALNDHFASEVRP